MANNNNREKDLLRAKFTSWLSTTLVRARADYIDRLARQPLEVSLDSIPANLIADPKNPYEAVERNGSNFEFEEARLANAFAELPLMRREVLRLLFVEMKDPDEISAILHCSTQYVNLQKFRALKRLRELLMEGGDDLG